MAQTQFEEAKMTIREFRELIETPGWKSLKEVARAQIEARRAQHSRTPAIGTEGMLKQQWDFGEACGIELFLSLPQSLIDGAEAIIQEGTENENAE
jgi:hypothetical protein